MNRSNTEAFKAIEAAVKFAPYIFQPRFRFVIVIEGMKGPLEIVVTYTLQLHDEDGLIGWNCVLRRQNNNNNNNNNNRNHGNLAVPRVRDPLAHASIVFSTIRITSVDVAPYLHGDRELYNIYWRGPRTRENNEASAERRARHVIGKWRSRVAYERALRPGGAEWALAKRRFEAAQRKKKPRSKSQSSNSAKSLSGSSKRAKKSV